MDPISPTGRIPLSPHDVHVWCADPERIEPADLPRYCDEMLAPEERERYERYAFEQDRRLFLTARVLLRTALSQYRPASPAAWRFVTDDYGKPRIESPPQDADLRFSLTHTAGLAVCAVAWERAVGVDAERVTRSLDWRPIAESHFARQEVLHLQALPEAEQRRAFFQYWTLKEAFLKAYGKGLLVPLDAFWLELDAEPAPRIHFTSRLPEPPNRWQLFLLASTPEHQLALAVEQSR